MHDAAGGADHRDGDREGDPALPRSRGLPAAPAALVDGRAHEPVHVAVDRRARGRRAASASTSCCSTPGGRACSPTRSAGRRCAASAARPASTSAPSTGRPAGTPTTRRTPGRSGRSSRPSSRARAGPVASLPFASSLCGACYDVCPVADRHPVDPRARAGRRSVARERAGRRGPVAEAARPRVRDPGGLRAGAAARPLAAAARRPRRVDHALPARARSPPGDARATCRRCRRRRSASGGSPVTRA